jgi:L-ascorbate metabolism protein UlaG (beta-lactamase superfamily)
MEITWYGLSCFRLTERGSSSVITDPYPDTFGYVLPRSRADIVTVSLDEPARNEVRGPRGPFRLLTGPGEYEIGGIFVTGVALSGARSRRAKPILNVAFKFEFDGVTVCHLGALNHVPSQSEFEALGTVNALLTPIGGEGLITAAQAAEVVSILEPNVVIPMHYHTAPSPLKLPRVASFLKEMGSSDVESAESLKITPSSLPEETRLVILDPRQ